MGCKRDMRIHLLLNNVEHLYLNDVFVFQIVPQRMRNVAVHISENRIVAQNVASIIVFLTFLTALSPFVSTNDFSKEAVP